MDPYSYGPMLIPVVILKLPENLKLTITRQFSQDLWDIKLILESFKNELAVLEKLSLTKAADKDEFEFNAASGRYLYTCKILVCLYTLYRFLSNLVVFLSLET